MNNMRKAHYVIIFWDYLSLKAVFLLFSKGLNQLLGIKTHLLDLDFIALFCRHEKFNMMIGQKAGFFRLAPNNLFILGTMLFW